MRYLVVYQKTDHNTYSAFVPDVPTCAATGDSIEQTRARILDALLISTRTMDWMPQPQAFTEELDPEEASEEVRELLLD